MKPFKRYVLKNGLRVLLVPNKQNLATTALVLVEAGSEYESKKINGISHFLEHMCFKGTKKRPTALALSTEMDSLGAEYNAFTGHEFTGYYAKVNPEKISAAMEIVSDLYLNPVFEEKEFEKEKGVIVEEINRSEDLPVHKVSDLFFGLMYGDQPAGWTITGKKEIIRSMTRKDLVNYRKAHYVPNATIVVIAGTFNEKKILEEIKKLFGHIPEGKKVPKPKTKELQKFPRSLVYFKSSGQTQLILGFRAFDTYDKRRRALKLLGKVLGGSMSSRLFQRVREHMGAAYSIHAGTMSFIDHGFLQVSGGVDTQRADKVVSAILDELKKVTEKLVPKEELEKAKNHSIGNFLIGLETSDEQALFYGEQELLKKNIKTPQQVAREMKAVTSKDLMKVARDVIRNQGLNLAILGPFRDAHKFEKILKL
ncbi:MAG: pitrilysin family protein [Candidatus Pacebacteria bacterium]|nr:pitrilysin family protein [Candidatus Paceibacterota bacterium]